VKFRLWPFFLLYCPTLSWRRSHLPPEDLGLPSWEPAAALVRTRENELVRDQYLLTLFIKELLLVKSNLDPGTGTEE